MNTLENLNLRDTTTTFELRRGGQVVPLWNPNKLGRIIGLRIPGVTGAWRDALTIHNTITNVGHAAANARISGQGAYNPFVNIALGTGTQATPATSTALAAEITTLGGGRAAATASQVTTTVTNDTTSLSKVFTFTGALAITEEGIFDSASASSGNMFAYQSFAVINVVNADTLTVTHKYQS
ncbi:MAG TPA: hypothetical protein DEQ40_19080 [Oxalobacteraceae bacterium]|jgi:hypothetical protein|nr:hypothetical protein [Oxalobacteraceae bacterium]